MSDLIGNPEDTFSYISDQSGCVTLLQLVTAVVGTSSGCSEVIDQNDAYLRCMQSFNRLFEDVSSLRAGPDKENATASVLCR